MKFNINLPIKHQNKLPSFLRQLHVTFQFLFNNYLTSSSDKVPLPFEDSVSIKKIVIILGSKILTLHVLCIVWLINDLMDP